jgi:membrane associated rhomboid family serine protease
MFTITIAIIALTCVISFIAFSNEKLMDDLIFYPPAITYHNQWYRFITCGVIHADLGHLFFNMYSFYMFGDAIETAFTEIFGEKGKLIYLLLYVSSLVVCLLPTYFNNKDNYHYKSLGASGAVSAIVFAYIFLAPTQKLGLIFIPFYFPAFIFGILYLGISAYLARRGNSRINHSAHLWGALYGIAFLVLFCNLFSDYRPLERFTSQVFSYFR